MFDIPLGIYYTRMATGSRQWMVVTWSLDFRQRRARGTEWERYSCDRHTSSWDSGGVGRPGGHLECLLMYPR